MVGQESCGPDMLPHVQEFDQSYEAQPVGSRKNPQANGVANIFADQASKNQQRHAQSFFATKAKCVARKKTQSELHVITSSQPQSKSFVSEFNPSGYNYSMSPNEVHLEM
jgi:hypothetical protein